VKVTMENEMRKSVRNTTHIQELSCGATENHELCGALPSAPRGLRLRSHSLLARFRPLTLALATRPFLTATVVLVALLVGGSSRGAFTTINYVLLDSAPYGGNHLLMEYDDSSHSTASSGGESEKCAARVAVPRLRDSRVHPKPRFYKQTGIARLELKEPAKVHVHLNAAFVESGGTIIRFDGQSNGLAVQRALAVAAARSASQLKEVRLQYLFSTVPSNRTTGEMK
jgi:hypothetical protein